jgi:hypothetical protein
VPSLRKEFTHLEGGLLCISDLVPLTYSEDSDLEVGEGACGFKFQIINDSSDPQKI